MTFYHIYFYFSPALLPHEYSRFWTQLLTQGSFQRDYISGVVSEAMEEWCSGVECRLWGLQYSLLRQL